MRWMQRSGLAFLIGAAAACTATPPAPTPGAPSGRVAATLEEAATLRTSRALAEVLVLFDRQLAGAPLRDFVDAKFEHRDVIDLLGRPFEDLVFVRGAAVDVDRRYPSCEDGGLTAAVGATRAQVPLNWSRCGTALADQLAELAAQIGADPSAPLIAAEASTYLMLDRDGTYWDLDSRSPLTAKDVDALTERYVAAWTEASAPETRAMIEDTWAPFADVDKDSAALIRDDGSIDVAGALAYASDQTIRELTDAEGPPSDAPRQNVYSTWSGSCYGYWWFGWHTLGCDQYESGSHLRPYRTQAHYPNQFSGFTVPKCVGAGTEINVAGCGPAAFASLVDWTWRNGAAITGAGFSHGNEPYTGGWTWATRPNQLALYQRVEAQAIGPMAACGLGANGVMTLPWNFVSGANAWLSANAPGISLGSHWSTLVGNAFQGNGWASELRARIGYDVAPVVAGFHIPGEPFTYHYSPVDNYYVTRPWIGLTGVRITSIDGYTSWLTNPFSLFSGLFWLQGATSGCRFGDEKNAWSCNGKIPGYTCTQILEPSDPHTWTDNYWCTRTGTSYAWSSAGPIGGLACVQTLESADPYTWSDNYLCRPGSAPAWTSAWTSASSCIRWSEPADPHTWDDNFLCP